jgi:hypothetical protein
MKFLKYVLIALTISLSFSCASGYKPVNLNSIEYPFTKTDDGVILKYRFGFLNKKYSKKEQAKGVKLIAVKITNTTDKAITIGKDFHFVNDNGDKLMILGPENTSNKLKQISALHLIYLAMAPINLFVTKTSGNQTETKTYPIGLISGAGLALGNMLTASSANKKLKEQLYDGYIVGSSKGPGKELTGIVSVKTDYFTNMRLVKIAD